MAEFILLDGKRAVITYLDTAGKPTEWRNSAIAVVTYYNGPTIQYQVIHNSNNELTLEPMK